MNQSEAAVIIALLAASVALVILLKSNDSEEYEVAHVARLEGQLTEAKLIRDARIARQEKAGKS